MNRKVLYDLSSIVGKLHDPHGISNLAKLTGEQKSLLLIDSGPVARVINTLKSIKEIVEGKTTASRASSAMPAILEQRALQTTPGKTILCHIVADSILPDAQKKEGILNRLDIAMRNKSYSEKMVELKVDDSKDFIQQVKDRIREVKDYYEREYGDEYKNYTFKFDVACSSTDIVARVQNELDLPSLAFNHSEGDIVQIEGIMLALRALYDKENGLDALCNAFEILTGTKPNISGITHIDAFARRIIFILPTVKSINYNEDNALNRRIEENIKTAA